MADLDATLSDALSDALPTPDELADAFHAPVASRRTKLRPALV